MQVSRARSRLLPAAVVLGVAASVLAARTEWPIRRTPVVPVRDGEAQPVLTGTVLAASSALALPTRIAVVGDYLVVLDAASDSALHVLDRRSGRLVRSLGRRGEGPGEFKGAWSLAPDPRTGDAVWVYDLPLRRLTRVALPPAPEGRASARRLVHLAGGAVLTGPRWIGPDSILSPGFLSDIRVALFDSTGRQTGGLGHAPFSADARQPMQAAQALLAAHPERHRYAIANRYVSRIELLDVERGSSRTVPGPVPVNTEATGVDLERFAYVDAAGTATGVVALFSGRNREEYAGSAGFGDQLHLFDWEGRFLGAYRLDADVLAISVDESEGYVYALRHDPVPAVLRYRLPAAAYAAGARAGAVTSVAAIPASDARSH